MHKGLQAIEMSSSIFKEIVVSSLSKAGENVVKAFQSHLNMAFLMTLNTFN